MNKHTAIKMLELSSSSYSDSLPLCRYSTVEFIESAETDTECFVRSIGDTFIIAFRGTDSYKNWINNFCLAKKVVPYGNEDSEIRIHCGFLKNYKSVRNKIHKLIPDKNCRIIVTGHSMGAALAVLCAVDIQYNHPSKDIEAYIFGCPRVGNAAFRKSYDARGFKTLRFCCGNDIVTKVPPAIFGYRHVGIPIHIGGLSLPFKISFSDHHPKNYYRNLFGEL